MASSSIKLDELTISQVRSAYRRGIYTCHQLVQAYLDRIAAIDDNGPKIGAVLAISSTALQEADRLDEYFKSTSNFFGSLHGVPVLLKDQVETKDIATTYGSIVARNSDNIPVEDATVVRKLKEAGTVILGKTTMPGKSPATVSQSRQPYQANQCHFLIPQTGRHPGSRYHPSRHT